jgi:hypothetical protein
MVRMGPFSKQLTCPECGDVIGQARPGHAAAAERQLGEQI